MSLAPFEVVAAPASARAASRRGAWIYALFCAYGVGSSWMVVGLSWLQLPVYQERFGLDTASKMTIGYQTGALAVPGFMLARFLLRLVGRKINYVALIWALLVLQAAVCVLGAADAPEWWVPVSINILGGFLGYATDAVHQGYILMNFDILYVGAYWIGDDFSGLYAASFALIQEPGLGKEGRRFGPRAFYLTSLPLVPVSMLAFWLINHFQPGTPPAAEEEQWGAATNNSHVQLEAASEFSQSNTAITFPKNVETVGNRGEVLNSTALDTMLKKESKAALVAAAKGTWLSLLPQGLRTQPRASLIIVTTMAWIQFGCWGVGDPLMSFACSHGSRDGKGLSCVADITEGSIVANLLGKFVASAVLRLGHRCLKPWIGVLVCLFSVAFVLLFLAASLGGIWSSLGGSYVVALMLFMRFFFSVLLMLSLAVLQAEYDESEVEDMNVLIALFGQGSSVLGTVLASVLIAEGEVK